nr:response regulator [Aurantimonas sp. VKM B-3413]
MIAEDDLGVRRLVSRALGLEGHDIVTAEDGEMALEILEESEGGFDLLLSDIRMPAMTGIELAHATAEKWPSLPILLMTGYAEQKEAAEDLAAIVVGVLDKPFSIADIRRQVSVVLAAAADTEAQADEDEDDADAANDGPRTRRCA